MKCFESVIKWYGKKFPERKSWPLEKHMGHLYKKLVEEIGELGEQLIWEALPEEGTSINYELADIMICIIVLADYLKIDINKVVQEKLEIVKKRK